MEDQQKQLKTLKAFQQIKTELQTKYQKIQSAFDTIDENGSGFIEIDDMTIELTNNHGLGDEEVIQSIFDVINTSKSGKITLDEFETLWTQIDREVSSLQKKIDFQQAKPQNQEQAKPEIEDDSRTMSKGVSINNEEFLSNQRGLERQGSSISPTRVTFDYHSNVQPLDSSKFRESKYQESKLRITPTRSQKISFLTNNVMSPNKVYQQKSSFLRNNQAKNVANNNSGVLASKATMMKKGFNSHLAFVGLGSQPKQRTSEYGNLSSNLGLFTQTFRTSPVLKDNQSRGVQIGRYSTGIMSNKSLSRSPERYVLENFALKHYMNKINSQRSSLVQSLKSLKRERSSDAFIRPIRRSIF